MANETGDAIAAVAGGGFSAGLDSFLNVAIPLVVFAMFGFMIYKAFQEPLDKLFNWIGEKWKAANAPPDEQHTSKFSGIQLDSRAEIYK
jgi:hypothetical protein